jgi:glycosyltransferase involved in cell wall biosynthesis
MTNHEQIATNLSSVINSDVTIVLCTYNRSAMLRNALESLTDLRTDNRFTYDVLVIDNASIDDTATVVEQFAQQTKTPITCVLETQQGVVHARNRGIAEAQGQWIAFFDDDQLADPNWLLSLIEMAWKKNVRCVGGAVHLQLPDDENRQLAPVCRMLLGETVGMDSIRIYNHRVTPGTGNLLIQKTVFDEIGVFDPAFHQRGEDTNLFLRMLNAGINGWYTPAAIVHHIIPPERLKAESLKQLAMCMVEGLAEDEQDAWGRFRYPFIWAARVGQAAMLFVPRLIWAWIKRDSDQLLGAKCRLAIAARYIRDGWSLMSPLSRKTPTSHPESS